jgi:hypothetical protein
VLGVAMANNRSWPDFPSRRMFAGEEREAELLANVGPTRAPIAEAARSHDATPSPDGASAPQQSQPRRATRAKSSIFGRFGK